MAGQTKERACWSTLGFDLVTLRIFMAAAEERSIAAAAARENIAPSAVSRRITEFEARAGVKLFHRHDRGVTPTATGRKLLEEMRGIFSQLDQIAKDLGKIRAGDAGHVRIHAHPTAASGKLSEMIASFTEKYPDIELHVQEASTPEIVDSVKRGAADIGVISGDASLDSLQTLFWQEDGAVAILPSHHMLSNKESVSLADLLEYPFITLRGTGANISPYRHESQITSGINNERYCVSSLDSLRRMVSVGLGVAIIPASMAYPYQNMFDYAIRPVSDPWAQNSIMLCLRDSKQLSPASIALLRHLTDEHGGECRHAESAIDIAELIISNSV